MDDKPLMNASACDAVVAGTCVMLAGDTIFYAGPIKGGPDTAGLMVLLNPIDFDKLKTLVDRHKN